MRRARQNRHERTVTNQTTPDSSDERTTPFAGRSRCVLRELTRDPPPQMIRENTDAEEATERASQSRDSRGSDGQPSVLRRQQATGQRQHGEADTAETNGRRFADQRSGGRRLDRRASGSVRADDETGGTNIRIGSPDSRYEREAESVAQRVTAETYGVRDLPGTTTQSGAASDAPSAAEHSATVSDAPTSVQRSPPETEQGSADTEGQTAPESVRDVVSTPGQKIDSGVVRRVESQTGEEFGDVSVHTGPKAAKSARDVGARAYTVGSDIVFDSGEYAPGTPSGDSVIAHELTHVAQQSRGVSRLQRLGRRSRTPGPTPLSESELDARTEAVLDRCLDQFVEQDYWNAVHRQARKVLDVSGSGTGQFEGGAKKRRASNFRREIERAVQEQAKADIDRSGRFSNTASGEYERERAKKQAEEQAAQSVDAELARYAYETTEAVVDRERDTGGVARLFGSAAGSGVVADFVDEFKQGISRRRNRGPSLFKSSQRTQIGQDLSAKEIEEAYRKTVRNLKLDTRAREQVQRYLQGTGSAVTERAERRASEEDRVATKALDIQAESAAGAFTKLGRRLEGFLAPGETGTVSASITVKYPDKEVPISGTISASFSAARSDDNEPSETSFTISGNVKINVSADAEVVSGGINLGKQVSASGTGADNTMAMLSYMLYRQSLRFGTETIANHLWGAGQSKKQRDTSRTDQSVSARLRAQRWAAATEERLLQDDNAAAETGELIEGTATAEGDLGVLKGSVTASIGASTAEYYDPVAIRYALDQRQQTVLGVRDRLGIKNKLERAGLRSRDTTAASMAGKQVTDSAERRRREKQSGGRKNKVYGSLSGKVSIGLPGKTLAADLAGQMSVDDISGFSASLSLVVPSVKNLLPGIGDVANYLIQAVRTLVSKSKEYDVTGSLSQTVLQNNAEKLYRGMGEKVADALLTADGIGFSLNVGVERNRRNQWDTGEQTTGKKRLSWRLALVRQNSYSFEQTVPAITSVKFNYSRKAVLGAIEGGGGDTETVVKNPRN